MKYIIFLGLIVFVFIVLPIIGVHIDTGNGSQVGYVSAVEKDGIFFKTYRAYIKPTLESTQEDVYCVIDEEVYAQLADASVNNSKIKASYFSWLSAGVTNCTGEGAIISSITTL